MEKKTKVDNMKSENQIDNLLAQLKKNNHISDKNVQVSPKKNVEKDVQVATKEVAKEKLPPKRYSNWFLSINSNKNMASYDSDQAKKILSEYICVIDNFFNNELVNNFLKLGDVKNPRAWKDKPLQDRIISINIDYVHEIGKDQNRLHTHGLVKVTKRGVATRLDYSKIKKHLNEKLGYNVHFKSKLYTDARSTLKDYMLKTLDK